MSFTSSRIAPVLALGALLAGPPAVAIKNPTPVGPAELLGMVEVRAVVDGETKVCSGMAIGSNTILTAAHCVCTANLVFPNVCASVADVTFRGDDGTGLGPRLDGTVSRHPGYNPSWTDAQYEHDLAVITLTGSVSPAHATPFVVDDGYLATGATARLVGEGHTGSTCSVNGVSGTFNWDHHPLDYYEDGRDIAVFEGQPACSGDSGGAVMDAAGDRLFGVLSANTYFDFSLDLEDSTTKAITTGSEFDWIKSQMCFSSAWNQCDGHGDVCRCSASTQVLWRSGSGQIAIWFMDGGTITGEAYPGTAAADWQIQGSGDFDADGHDDILWRHSSGQVAIWFMIDGAIVGQAYPGGQDPGHSWAIQAVGDFDGDRYSDILWRSTDGQLAIWFRGDNLQAGYPGYGGQSGPVPLEWQVLGVGDFDGDAHSDILWRRDDGQIAVWLMQGATQVGESYPGSRDPSRYLIEAIGDFDGNLRSDILWRSTENGLLNIWFNGGEFNSLDFPTYANQPPDYGASYDPTWQVQGVGDFDHDGRDDILWRHSGGQVGLWLIHGMRFVGDLYPRWVDNDWQIQGLIRPGLASIRTLPEPPRMPALALGAALLAALNRRRRARSHLRDRHRDAS